MNLKIIARERGTNLKKLAETCGVPASTLYSISRGDTNIERVGVGMLMKVAQALDMTLGELYEAISHDECATVDIPEGYSADECMLIELYRYMGTTQRNAFEEVARSLAATSGMTQRQASSPEDAPTRSG